MKRISRLSIILTVLVALVVLVPTAVVLADTFSKTVTNTMTISASNPSLKVYSDPECTVEITSIDWGNIKQGKTEVVNIYLKNEGDYDFTTIATTNNFPAAAGTLTFTGSGQPLAIGAVSTLGITATVSRSAPVGATPFNVNINPSY